LTSPATMAELNQSATMWSQLRQHAVVEYMHGDWECLLEHQANQRFYYNKATGASQWEPPQVTGDWMPAEHASVKVNDGNNHTGQVKVGEVWHEVRTPKGKNLYFFEANSGRSEWELPSGVVAVQEHGAALPSTPKGGKTFGFDNKAGNTASPSAIGPQAAKMWSVLRGRSKQVRHVGNWSEFLDEASNEVFYYNTSEGTCQWECPLELKIDYSGHVPLHGHAINDHHGGGASDYSITL